jgi:hypothetical protein
MHPRLRRFHLHSYWSGNSWNALSCADGRVVKDPMSRDRDYLRDNQCVYILSQAEGGRQDESGSGNGADPRIGNSRAGGMGPTAKG